jgi:hypothetical protein
MDRMKKIILYFKFTSYISEQNPQYKHALRDAILNLYAVLFLIGIGFFFCMWYYPLFTSS